MLSDIDQFKHMSFANYLKLMFLASDALFLAFSNTQKNFFNKIYLKAVKSQMHFKHQTSFGDEILVKVYAAHLMEKRFELFYRFTIEGWDEAVAHGRQEFEVMDILSLKPVELPTPLKSFLGIIEIDPEKDFPDLKKMDERPVKVYSARNGYFVFDKCAIFFKHTDQLGLAHPYHFMEWTSFVREAFFLETVSNFKEVLARPIKMMTTKIYSQIFNDSEFGDIFEARLTVGKIKKLSFEMIIRFVNKRKKEVAAETVHAIVFVDSEKECFSDIPKEMMEVIVHYREPEPDSHVPKAHAS
jgi:acyl-CoA thioesterase FadM